MDLKDAIQLVASLAVAGQSIRTLPYPGNEDRAFLLIDPATNTVTPQAKPLKAPPVTVRTPADLAAFINGLDTSNTEYTATKDAAVVLNELVVTYFPDLDDRLRKAATTLVRSDQFAWFKAFGGKELTQKDFVRALRVTLGGCIPSSLLASVRNVSWNRTTTGTVAVNSLGKSVMDDLKSEGMPEEVIVTMPVFVGVNFNGQFKAYVEVDPSNQKFCLIPEPQALERITEQALRAIAGNFEGVKVQVIIGE